MRDFSAVFDVKAPPAAVLAVLFDIARWPEWTATVTSLERLDDGPLKLGGKARICQPNLPPAVWHVVELDGQSGFSWSTRISGVRIKGGHLVEAADAGSKVTLSLAYSGPLAPLIGFLYRSFSQRYLAIEAEGLRKRCEG